MSKNFLIAVVVGIVFLAVVIFFAFGLNGKPSETSPIETFTQTTDTKIPEDLKIEDTKVGTGSAVKSGDNIVINYLGTLSDEPNSIVHMIGVHHLRRRSELGKL